MSGWQLNRFRALAYAAAFCFTCANYAAYNNLSHAFIILGICLSTILAGEGIAYIES